MYDYLFVTIAVALVAAFALLLLKKWGVIEWLQVHGNDLISQLASCDFCLSWWICLLVSIVIAILMHDPCCIITAILATPVTRKLQ